MYSINQHYPLSLHLLITLSCVNLACPEIIVVTSGRYHGGRAGCRNGALEEGNCALMNAKDCTTLTLSGEGCPSVCLIRRKLTSPYPRFSKATEKISTDPQQCYHYGCDNHQYIGVGNRGSEYLIGHVKGRGMTCICFPYERPALGVTFNPAFNLFDLHDTLELKLCIPADLHEGIKRVDTLRFCVPEQYREYEGVFNTLLQLAHETEEHRDAPEVMNAFRASRTPQYHIDITDQDNTSSTILGLTDDTEYFPALSLLTISNQERGCVESPGPAFIQVTFASDQQSVVYKVVSRSLNDGTPNPEYAAIADAQNLHPNITALLDMKGIPTAGFEEYVTRKFSTNNVEQRRFMEHANAMAQCVREYATTGRIFPPDGYAGFCQANTAQQRINDAWNSLIYVLNLIESRRLFFAPKVNTFCITPPSWCIVPDPSGPATIHIGTRGIPTVIYEKRGIIGMLILRMSDAAGCIIECVRNITPQQLYHYIGAVIDRLRHRHDA